MPAPRTPQDMLKIVAAKLEPRTGRTFDQWVEVARGSGIATHKALTDWLKGQGLNHNEAQWVAWGVIDPGRVESYERPDDLENELYVGKKAHLRPVYDRLMEVGKALGADVKPNVCRTYASLAAGTQFVIFAPRTNSAVDVELALPPGWSGPGAEPFKSANPKFSHRIRVASPEAVDDRVVEALRAALAHARK